MTDRYRTLLLLRHAKSDWPPGVPDHERPLAPRGEREAKLAGNWLRAHAPALTRLTLLLKLASGEAAPLGPVADKARTEALKLARHDSTRSELAIAPDRVDAIRDLLQHAALAA